MTLLKTLYGDRTNPNHYRKEKKLSTEKGRVAREGGGNDKIPFQNQTASLLLTLKK